MSTISKERATGIANGAKCYTHDDVVELARIALASLEAEPVAWTDADELRDARNGGTGYLFALCGDANKFADPRRQLMLYTAAPAPLVSDEIAVALITAIEKEQDRLFGQDYLMDSKDCIDVIREEMERLNARCAAMLHGAAGSLTSDGNIQATQFKPVADLYEMQFDDGGTCAFHADGAKAVQWLLACDGNKVQEYVKMERYQEAMLGNSPAIPDGWKLVPVELTGAMTNAMTDAILDDLHNVDVWRSVLAAAPQQEVKWCLTHSTS
ncbi:hypothetical protein ACPDTC_000200 [Escherichia coli]